MLTFLNVNAYFLSYFYITSRVPALRASLWFVFVPMACGHWHKHGSKLVIIAVQPIHVAAVWLYKVSLCNVSCSVLYRGGHVLCPAVLCTRSTTQCRFPGTMLTTEEVAEVWQWDWIHIPCTFRRIRVIGLWIGNSPVFTKQTVLFGRGEVPRWEQAVEWAHPRAVQWVEDGGMM